MLFGRWSGVNWGSVRRPRGRRRHRGRKRLVKARHPFKDLIQDQHHPSFVKAKCRVLLDGRKGRQHQNAGHLNRRRGLFDGQEPPDFVSSCVEGAGRRSNRRAA